MAAFTHIGTASRFSDGGYGVYYAAKDLETAITESTFSRARFLSYTSEDAGEVDMRVYVGEVVKPLHDIRGDGYDEFHLVDEWSPAQAFGQEMRLNDSWGIAFRSVRHLGGECIAVLRPPAVTIPRQGEHLSYVWDGTQITNVYKKTLIR